MRREAIICVCMCGGGGGRGGDREAPRMGQEAHLGHPRIFFGGGGQPWGLGLGWGWGGGRDLGFWGRVRMTNAGMF